MPMDWPVVASYIVPVSGSTIPLVFGSISCPEELVISPVLEFTVDVLDAELEKGFEDDEELEDVVVVCSVSAV